MGSEEKNSSTCSVNFSSTTALAESASKSSKTVNDNDCYNPFEHRSVEHPNSSTGALIHLLKSSLGSGILAMPSAFRNAGLLFGFIGTIVVGILCTHAVHLLVNASHNMCKKARIPVLGFSETAGAVFEYGPQGIRKFSTAAKYFVDCALVATYLLSNCVYVVFISESLRQLFSHWFPDSNFGIHIYMLFIMGPLLLVIQVRELKHLVPFSLLANVFLVVSFAITLYYLLIEIPDPKTRDLFTGFSTLPIFFSTAIFAMEGIGVILPIENSMSKPQQFLGCPGVLNIAMSIVLVLYGTLGFFGYLKFGKDTQGSVTLNLPVDEIPAQIVKLLIALSVFFTYFLQIYAPIDIVSRKLINQRVKGTTKRHIAQIALRCTIVCITLGVAAGVPDLEPIMGLVGSICFSTLGLLIPAVVDTVLIWDDNKGFLYWKLVKNVLLGAFAIFALIAGTAQSITFMME